MRLVREFIVHSAGSPMTIHAQLQSFITKDLVRCSVEVPVDRATAFESFRHDIYQWWPHEMTWSGEAVEDLFFEGRKGGTLWERGPEGFRCDFARVLRWVPPDWMLLRWHIAPGRKPQPDPAKASEVEIRFIAAPRGGTRIELEHRHFARHGSGWEAYCAAMGSAAGWPGILESFAAHCGAAPEEKPARLRPVAAAG